MVLKCKGNCGKILNPNLNKSGYCTSCRFKNPKFKEQRHKYYKERSSTKEVRLYRKEYQEKNKEYYRQYHKLRRKMIIDGTWLKRKENENK